VPCSDEKDACGIFLVQALLVAIAIENDRISRGLHPEFPIQRSRWECMSEASRDRVRAVAETIRARVDEGL